MKLCLALALLLLVLPGCASSQAPSCPYTGTPQYAPSAGCLTLVHNRILVVESTLGGITPPGGKSKQGESAQCAAHRETWEETGLELMPRQLLQVFDTGFHLYYCEIHARSGAIEPGPIHEVRRGFWLSLDDFNAVKWRFEGQGDALLKLIHGE